MEYPNISGEELKKLINFFKLIVVIVTAGLTILVSVALIVSYKDVSSMRVDLRNQGNDMKSELERLRSFS